MPLPLLNILLPTYNGAAYLEGQLDSILDQSMQDFRLLVVDDGSTDATPAILADAARRDRRVEVLPGGINQGQRQRLGQLAAASDTDLVAIADQDDLWDRDKLARLVDSLGEAALCFGASHLIDAEGKSLGRDLIDSLPPPYRPGDRLTYFFRPLVSAHALVARRELLNAKALGRALPFDWMMALEAAFGAGLTYQPAARTLHRLHGSNQSNSSFAVPLKRERLLSRFALRRAVGSWRRRRMGLLGMFEHLSYADTVSPGLRRDMASLRTTFADAWLEGSLNASALEKAADARLRPLAGSAADWAFAEVNLHSLFSSPLSPTRLEVRARRLALLAKLGSADAIDRETSAASLAT